jgi:toxin ParE1/3/4
MGRLLFSPAASADLDKITEDIVAAAGPQLALSFVARMQRSLKNLAEFPRIGRRRPNFGQGVRSWAFSPYIAFYRTQDDDVQIIRILHGKRRITRSLVRSTD